MREINKRRRVEEPEHVRAVARSNYHKHGEKRRAGSRADYRAKRELRIAAVTAYREQNPEKTAALAKASKANRRARLAVLGGRITAKQIEHLYLLQKGRCAGCRKKTRKFHLDHVIPIALGGANDISNAQVLCPSCNLKKGAMPDTEWAASLGRLFA